MGNFLPMSSIASASVAAEEQQPSKKNRPLKGSISISSLPDDLVVSFLARVSKLYYPNLSLVSKNFHSLLASPELYQTRNLLGRTESCLYVFLQFPTETNPRWFKLCQTLTSQKKESSGNLLVPIPILNSAPVNWSNIVSVDSNLYAISSLNEDAPCSNVSLFDCRTQTWRECPRMRMAHVNGELDGKMYLPGSFENPESLNCVEVYNKMTQTWKPVPPEKRKFKNRNMEGKVYYEASPGKGVTLKLGDLTYEVVRLDKVSVCVIENILYMYIPSGKIEWVDFFPKEAVWRNLEGLEELLPKFAKNGTVKLANCGGKLVVLWDKYVPASGDKEKMIWCAEVSLEKRKKEEIWGKVEWFDGVLTVPESYKFVCAIAAIV